MTTIVQAMSKAVEELLTISAEYREESEWSEVVSLLESRLSSAALIKQARLCLLVSTPDSIVFRVLYLSVSLGEFPVNVTATAGFNNMSIDTSFCGVVPEGKDSEVDLCMFSAGNQIRHHLLQELAPELWLPKN